MPANARKDIVREGEIGTYHCWSRCVYDWAPTRNEIHLRPGETCPRPLGRRPTRGPAPRQAIARLLMVRGAHPMKAWIKSLTFDRVGRGAREALAVDGWRVAAVPVPLARRSLKS